MIRESSLTRASLLIRLRDSADAAAWQEFVRLYGPLIYGFARNRGLQDADAADLLQDVLRSVESAVGRLEYDKQKGGFRAWLFTITRNKLANFINKRREQLASDDEDRQRLLANLVDRSADLEAEWDREFEKQLVTHAMHLVQSEFEPRSWQAFWHTAVEGRSAADVSREIGLSTGAIYVAKSRVLARLKIEVERLQAE